VADGTSIGIDPWTRRSCSSSTTTDSNGCLVENVSVNLKHEL
jgi:hypothetical protein